MGSEEGIEGGDVKVLLGFSREIGRVFWCFGLGGVVF